MNELFTNIFIIKLLSTAFLAVLFLQSGLDKVFNYAGNKAWIIGYFEKTFLKNTAGSMFIAITILEVVAGVFCAIGVVGLFIGLPLFGLLGTVLSGVSLLALFFGARIAADYATAGGLVTYFLVVLANLYVYSL